MSDNKKDAIFKDLIFKSYGQIARYDKLRHNLLNVRQTMMSKHKSFKDMSVGLQFAYCETISTIVVHSLLQHLNEHRPFTLQEEQEYKYSVDRNWKQVTKVSINDKLTPCKQNQQQHLNFLYEKSRLR